MTPAPDYQESEISLADPELMRCYYCGFEKPPSDFSDEHIWPDALGGDELPSFWRTNNVCRACNSMSGVFVDGAFIRGWAGSAERGSGARDYMSLTEPGRSSLPLDYLGKLVDAPANDGEIAEWWAGPCGAHIVHFRPGETEDLWTTYLGGDPRAKKSHAGRAYIALASAEEYWVIVALQSFKKHFGRAKRHVVTSGLPPEWTAFAPVDRSDPVQASDLVVVDSINEAAKTKKSVHAQVVIQTDAGNRFLAKLGLAIGCQLFGAEFGDHVEGANLRRFFRQPDPKRRESIPIHGAGYFSSKAPADLDILTWTGGWVLIVQVVRGNLAVMIITPGGRRMGLKITDDTTLLAKLDVRYRDGICWLTIPSISKAVGPLTLPEYVAHLTGSILNPELLAIEHARIDPSALPPC